MADQSDLRFKTGQATGQAQMKKDELLGKASDTCQQGKEEAGGFIQQAGAQVLNMAHGAAETVKNAVGMGESNTNRSGTTTTRTTTTRL